MGLRGFEQVEYTPEIIAVLVDDWNANKSTREIAEHLNREFGYEFNRNMVIGKINRLRKAGLNLAMRAGK